VGVRIYGKNNPFHNPDVRILHTEISEQRYDFHVYR